MKNRFNKYPKDLVVNSQHNAESENRRKSLLKEKEVVEKGILSSAVKKGDIELVKDLLTKKVDINEVDMSGSTPLHHAVWYGRFDIIKLLLEAGADVNVSIYFFLFIIFILFYRFKI